MNDIEANNLNINCLTSKNNNFSLDSDGNLVVKSITTEITNNLTIDNIYPVGSIYLSVNNVNPSTIFGGTWENFGAGRCLVGVNPNETEFNSVEKTGGEKTHKLVVNETPSHTHGSKSLIGKFFSRRFGTSGEGADLLGTAWGTNGGGIVSQASETWSGSHAVVNIGARMQTNPKIDGFKINATHEHTSVGGNMPHNNLQPFITCYMWKRVA